MDADYLDQLVRRGVISPDVLERMTEGEPQRQSRGQILQQGLDSARDYLTPSYFRDTPSSPQADRALADPNARPGKIGPPSGPPTTAQMIGGFAGDVGLNALPFGKLAGAGLAKWLGMAGFPAWWKTNPEKAALVDNLIAQGSSRSAIVNHPDVQIGNASLGRYLDATGQKTAAAENPSFWDTPGVEEGVKADIKSGMSQARAATKWGTTPGSVSSKVGQWREAGEFEGVELRPSDQSKALLKDPVKRADLIRLAVNGESLGNIASYFFGGFGGKHPRRGEISTKLKQLREEGTPEEREALKNYVRQGGIGLTAAGRTPTLVKTKSQAHPIDAEDLKFGQDFARALSAFTQSGPPR